MKIGQIILSAHKDDNINPKKEGRNTYEKI